MTYTGLIKAHVPFVFGALLYPFLDEADLLLIQQTEVRFVRQASGRRDR